MIRGVAASFALSGTSNLQSSKNLQQTSRDNSTVVQQEAASQPSPGTSTD